MMVMVMVMAVTDLQCRQCEAGEQAGPGRQLRDGRQAALHTEAREVRNSAVAPGSPALRSPHAAHSHTCSSACPTAVPAMGVAATPAPSSGRL